MNIVIISGNLTRTPELRASVSGTSILTFGVAVNDRKKNANGEWEDVPCFVDCVMFGKRADSLAKILDKGMRVTINGKLNYSSWERDGQRRSKIEIVCNDVELPPRAKGRQQADTQEDDGIFNEDCPF